MRIYVDIDGTLTKEIEGWGDEIYAARTPRKEVIARVNELFDLGHTITIWTARFPEDEVATLLWLEEHGVKFSTLVMGKPLFDVYLCDKVVNVENIHEDKEP